MTVLSLVEKIADADLLREMTALPPTGWGGGWTSAWPRVLILATRTRCVCSAQWRGRHEPERARFAFRSSKPELLPKLSRTASDGGKGSDGGYQGGLHSGISTRYACGLVKAMGMSGISKIRMSRQ